MLEHVGEDVVPVAVVKGNGYGHGLTVAAQVFLDAGFQALGVADLNEALTLRQVRLCPLPGRRPGPPSGQVLGLADLNQRS